MSRGSRLSIVLPVLNEEENLPLLFEQIASTLHPLSYEWDVIFVDDGSTQPTVDVLRKLESSYSNVQVLQFTRNFGHQAALTAGLDFAHGDAVILMDSDLQHPPALLPELIARWEDGYDVVYTIRDSTVAVGARKRFTSWLFYAAFNALSDTDIPPHAADFRLLDRSVVDALKQMRERARFLRGLTSWVGFRQIGVHFTAAARTSGQSSYNSVRMLRLAIDGVASMSTLPLRMCLFSGVAVSSLATVYMLYVLFAWESHRVITGWSSLMLAVLFLGGVQLTTIGIVGLYVAKVYEEVKQRPLYLLRDRAEAQQA